MRQVPIPPGTEIYAGLHAYQDTDRDRQLFFGREREEQALLAQVLGERLSVLCSRSGLGKTSLINAGLLEPLRKQGYFAIVARVSQHEDPAMSVIEKIRTTAVAAGVELRGEPAYPGLWGFFQGTSFLKNGQRQRLVLVLDQFEELFTRVEPEARAAFVEDLADVARSRTPADVCLAAEAELNALGEDAEPKKRESLICLLYGEASPEVRILLSMREDYLAELEPLRASLPGVYRSLLRIEPLDVEEARKAILEPANRAAAVGAPPLEYDAEALEAILNFLAHKTGVRRGTQASVDPIQLQIVCSSLDARRRAAGRTRVTMADVGGDAGLSKILSRHYRDAVMAFPVVRTWRNVRGWRPSRSNLLLFNRPRSAIRRLCEVGLVTRGSRNSLMADFIEREYGVPRQDLEALVSQHRLLRADSRLDTQFYELTHDTLVKPIKADRLRRTSKLGGVLIIVFVATTIFGARILHWIEDRQARLEEAARARESQERVDQRLQAARADPVALSTAARELAKDSSTSLANAKLAVVDFSGLALAGKDFRGADLRRANFRDTLLLNANFANADLSQANFRGANVAGANFAGARTGGANFRGSTWWLAAGWSKEQERELQKSAPRAAVARSPLYLRDVATYQEMIKVAETEKDDNRRALSLNELAWYRVIRGVDLEEALDEINLALGLAKTHVAALTDTRGYLYLVIGDPAAARPDLEEALKIKRKEVPKGPELGEILYHLALAFERLGDEPRANQLFKDAEQNQYVPTYERYLTPRKQERGPAAS